MSTPTKRGAPRGNSNAAKGYPTKPNPERYPLTDGFPMLCKSCHVGPRCPGYERGAVCAYRREFRDLNTRDTEGVAAELGALVHAQRQRLQYGLLMEKLTGGRALPEVDQALDTQVNLLTTLAKFLGARRAAQGGHSEGNLSRGGLFDMLFNTKRLDPEAFAEAVAHPASPGREEGQAQ